MDWLEKLINPAKAVARAEAVAKAQAKWDAAKAEVPAILYSKAVARAVAECEARNLARGVKGPEPTLPTLTPSTVVNAYAQEVDVNGMTAMAAIKKWAVMYAALEDGSAPELPAD